MSAGLVWAAVAVWAALGAYVSFTDLRRAVIPRRAVWPAAAVGLARHGRDDQVRWAPGLVVGAASIMAWRLWVEGPVP